MPRRRLPSLGSKSGIISVKAIVFKSITHYSYKYLQKTCVVFQNFNAQLASRSTAPDFYRPGRALLEKDQQIRDLRSARSASRRNESME